MPNETSAPLQQGYTNWNYNWSQVYMNVYAEAVSLHYLYPDDQRLTYDGSGNIPQMDQVIESGLDRRVAPNLLISGSMDKVLCRENPNNYREVETREKEQAKVRLLQERFGKFCAAVDEKQIEMAAENPEGASFFRMMRDKASFAMRNYGVEAMNDYSFNLISSQEGAIHLPNGNETSPIKGEFTRNMDELSDMPFMPVYENASRMVNIACDHANAAKAGTLTPRQDRLARRLLLTQYDHIAAGIEETVRVTGDKNTEDFKRWAAAMDNPPSDLGVYSRGCFRVPYDMEGRRIALRQGWPVEDASMIGSLFVLQSRLTDPQGLSLEYSPSVKESLADLLQEISSTRISSPEIRTEKLNHIFDYLAQNQKELHLDQKSVTSFTDLWKTFEIQPCQYLSEQELDQAAQDYERRSALPHVAGSDGSPVGYYEQALAGTEVLSRLSAMREVMAPVNKGRRDLPEYTRLRAANERLIDRISGLYGAVPPQGKDRTKLMEDLSADHMKLNELAANYLAKCSKSEPAFKRAAAQELRRFCYSCAQTAIYTDIGKGVASFRRSSLDWVMEIENEKQRAFQSEAEQTKSVQDRSQEPEPVQEQTGPEPLQPQETGPVQEQTGPEPQQQPQETGPVQEQPAAVSAPESTDTYLKYLEDAVGSYWAAKSAPKPDDLDFKGVEASELRLAELAPKQSAFFRILQDAGITFDELKKLRDLSAVGDRPRFDINIIQEKTTATCQTAIYFMCSDGSLAKRKHTETKEWKALSEEQKKARAAEILEEMGPKTYFDVEIFSQYADPGKQTEIIRRILPQEKINTIMAKELENAVTVVAGTDPMPVYRLLPQVLGADRVRSLVSRLDSDPILHQTASKTYCTASDEKAIEGLRTRIRAEEQDPKRREALLQALEGAEKLLSIPTQETLAATEQREQIGCNATSRYEAALCRKVRAEGTGDQVDRSGPRVDCNSIEILPSATDEGNRKIFDRPKLPSKAREAMLAMLRKMDSMEIIPKDATEFTEEEGEKVYGYRTLAAAKIRCQHAIREGKLEDLVQARADYDREYKNMNELLEMAREGFGGSGTSYTNTVNMFASRNPGKFAWDQMETPQQGQVNSVYLLYQQMRKFDLTPEQIVDEFPRCLMEKWYKPFREASDAYGGTNRDFASAVRSLMGAEEIKGEFRGEEYETAAHKAFESYTMSPPVRGIYAFSRLPDEGRFDRAGMTLWAEDAMNLFSDLANRERLRYSVLGTDPNQDPLHVRLRSEAIQNLITVADQDRDVHRMVGLPAYNEDLTLMKPFSLDKYVMGHEIDAEGMKRRLDTMIAETTKSPSGPSKEELLAEGLEACTRVLYTHWAERDTKPFKDLEAMAQGLTAQLPQQGAEEYRTRMENTMKRYRDFVAEPPLRELIQSLDDAKVAPEENEHFDYLRAYIQTLSERSGSLMVPQPDGTLPMLTPQSREDLKELYAGVVKYASDFCASAKGNPNLATALENAEKIGRMASRDMNILTGARGSDAVTLADVYQKRSPTLDVTNLTPEVVGGASNTRYAYKIPVEGGKTVEGYFTPEQPLQSLEDRMDALMQRISKISPDAAQAIRVMEANKSSSFHELAGSPLRTLTYAQKQNQGKYWNFLEYDNRYRNYLQEAGFSDKKIKAMTNQSFADAIDEYLTGKAKLLSNADTCNDMGLQPGDPMELRNGAMSAVADALGVGSLLAASRPVTLVRNGKPLHGVFMDKAVGSDCMNPGENDPILEMTADTPLSPKAKQELASIQVLDFICGNVDRHAGNLLYSFTRDNDGNVVLDGIQGIDNDLSFMGCEASSMVTQNQVFPEMLSSMPKSLADRVSQLTPAFLKTSLREFHLPEQQIEQAAERLKEVQKQITMGREFFKGKDINEVSVNCIHVVPDEEYGKIKPNMTTDRLLKTIPANVQAVREERRVLAQQKIFREDERKLAGLWTRIEASEKRVWFGSKEFGAMRDALHEVGYKHNMLLTGDRTNPLIPMNPKTLKENDLVDLRLSYEKLGRAADNYLLRKQNEMQRKGRLDEKSLERVQIARQIKQMLQPQTAHVEGLFNAQRLEAQAKRERKAKANAEAKTRMNEIKAGAAFTGSARLNDLLKTLTEQSEKRKQIKNGTLDRNDQSVMKRKDVAPKLFEAFAVVELVYAVGNANVQLDNKCVDLMYQALRTDKKKNPTQFEECMQQVKKALPDADLTKLHQDSYADVRKVISLSVNGDLVAERMGALTKLLSNPPTVFGSVRDRAQKLEAENKSLGLQNRNQKPDNNNKRGL